MSGPQGYDPNQQWASGQPGQEPSPSEPTQQAGWQQRRPRIRRSRSRRTRSIRSRARSTASHLIHRPIRPPRRSPPSTASRCPINPRPRSTASSTRPPRGTASRASTRRRADSTAKPRPSVTPPTAEKGSKSSLAVLGAVIGVLAAIIVAVVLVMGFWKPGFFVTTKLDVNKAQQGVKDILTNQTTGYGDRQRQRRQVQRRQEPHRQEGRHVHLRRQRGRHAQAGDGDVPGRQRHLRGRPAQVGP